MLSKIISRHRFEEILANWHWVDCALMTDVELDAKNRSDPFWSVEGLVKIISDTSQVLWCLHQAFDTTRFYTNTYQRTSIC